MSTTQKLSDFILEQGEDFQPDAMPDYHERVQSGEFKGKTAEQIRDIYFHEAVDREEEEDELEHFQSINSLEEDEELDDFDGADKEDDE